MNLILKGQKNGCTYSSATLRITRQEDFGHTLCRFGLLSFLILYHISYHISSSIHPLAEGICYLISKETEGVHLCNFMNSSAGFEIFPLLMIDGRAKKLLYQLLLGSGWSSRQLKFS